MKRLSISEAVAISPVGETTLRKHIKSGKLSAERDARGHYKIDATELARVYGTGHLIDTELLIQSYQNRIQDLNRQLGRV